MMSRTGFVALFAAQVNAVWLSGMNIAGCDIGMDTSGNFQPDTPFNSQYGCPTNVGPSQMRHFANSDGFNVFRLPVSWQDLVGNDLETNRLDRGFTDTYYGLIQSCLDTGAHCIIDIHNYARWWGEVIDQGGPNAGLLASTWSQIASDWAGQSRVIFGTMNEPHDLDINVWANTLQQVVYAIRDAGATSQIILLSGTDYANALSFQSNSAAALRKVVNRDGSTRDLIFELHQYFDGQGGKTPSCTQNLASDFRNVAGYLKSIGRQAFIGELGGGNGDDCVRIICDVLDALNDNGDQFIGWTAWAAGNWWSDYELNLMPDGGTDKRIVQQCFAPLG